jgi:acetyl esterase
MSDSRSPLDPQVKAWFDLLLPAKAARVLDAAALRAGSEATAAVLTMGSTPLEVERELALPSPAGPVRALLFQPGPAAPGARGLVVYLHGGGFMLFTPESHAKMARRIALGADAVVLSVDYRRTPEHPFPAALDDALAAFRHARANARELGADPARIAVAGDSAGGGLAAAVALRLAAAGEAAPAALLLISPWTDMRLESASFRRLAPDDPLIDAEVMTYWRDAYVPDPGRRSDPFASPLLGDASAFPRTCISVGTIDPLHDDGAALAAKLRAAGRPVVLQSHAGMPHYFNFLPGIDEGERSVAAMVAFLRDALK